MTSNEWNKIANLRWIWGFFASYSMGHILASTPKKIQIKTWHFTALQAVLLTVVAKHLNDTSGVFFFRSNRMQGFYSNPSYFAMAVVVLWATLLPFLIYSKNRREGVWAATVTTSLTIILIATYTRSAWLAMTSVLLFTLLYTKNSKAITVSISALLIGGAAIYLNALGMKDRVLQSFDLTGFAQVSRIEIWNATWNIFLDHPIFGVGFENARNLYQEYYIKLRQPTSYIPGHAHNQFLDVLSGAGIFGLIGYLGTFGTGIVFFHRRFKTAKELLPKQLSLGALLCIVALFGCSLTETPIIQQETRNYILIILGFSYGYLAYRKPPEINSLN
ncbi:O-antigen ligase family protein [Bdellovibrio bacteriovorus]|uniref:O-antigen ligase family protein n=1 Tax=Bdellovibrio bacteriovorus TaxID=959 RepID=UPI0035A574DE